MLYGPEGPCAALDVKRLTGAEKTQAPKARRIDEA
jgi:hypothetical protein